MAVADRALDLTAAFPPELAEDVRAVIDPTPGRHVSQDEACRAELETCAVIIPQRVSLDAPRSPFSSDMRRRIFDCVQTRHHDGHVREAAVTRLLTAREEWVCPFVWALLGDYVTEIVSVIAASLDGLDQGTYAAFVARNPRLVARVQRQAISYWNEGPRRSYPRFADYPAALVFAHFGVPLGVKQ